MAQRYSIFFMAILCQNSWPLIVALGDLHTMAKKSDIVVHGQVGEKTVSKDEWGRLITVTQIEVIDNMHGAKRGDVVSIYQVGGEKNGLVMPFLGGHQYKINDEIIFFGLKLDHSYVSYGPGQGKLDVLKENGQEVVREDLGDIEVVNKGDSKSYVPSPLSFSDLDALKKEINLMVNN